MYTSKRFGIPRLSAVFVLSMLAVSTLLLSCVGDRGEFSFSYCGSDGCWDCYIQHDDFDSSGHDHCREVCYPTSGSDYTPPPPPPSSCDCGYGFRCGDDGACIPACSSQNNCVIDEICDLKTDECVDRELGCDCPEDWTCGPRTTECVLDYVPCETSTDCPSQTFCSPEKRCESIYCHGVPFSCSYGMTCDTDTFTCVDTPETCQSEVICTTPAPICPIGTTPVIQNMCWTGACMAKSDCPDGAPFECRDLTVEKDCLSNEACQGIYEGMNCTSPDGSVCGSGDSDCVCESYEFARCSEFGISM